MSTEALSETDPARPEYRIGPLYRNRLVFMHYAVYKESQRMIHRLSEVNALLEILDSEVDPQVQLEPSIREKLKSMRKPFSMTDGVYTNKVVIEQAVRLHDAVPLYDAVKERAWTKLMENNV